LEGFLLPSVITKTTTPENPTPTPTPEDPTPTPEEPTPTPTLEPSPDPVPDPSPEISLDTMSVTPLPPIVAKRVGNAVFYTVGVANVNEEKWAVVVQFLEPAPQSPEPSAVPQPASQATNPNRLVFILVGVFTAVALIVAVVLVITLGRRKPSNDYQKIANTDDLEQDTSVVENM